MNDKKDEENEKDDTSEEYKRFKELTAKILGKKLQTGEKNYSKRPEQSGESIDQKDH